MDIVVANLEGEMAEWVTDLHYEGTPELTDPDAFFCGLRAQFGDLMQTQQAEAEIRNVRQGTRPKAEYIRSQGS